MEGKFGTSNNLGNSKTDTFKIGTAGTVALPTDNTAAVTNVVYIP